MSTAVVHFEIGAQNAGKLREFYTALFDWKFDTTDPSYAVMDETDHQGVGGGIMQIDENMSPYVTVYVAVDDVAAMLTRAEELGGIRVLGPNPVPHGGEFALFRDPEGHLIGLLGLES